MPIEKLLMVKPRDRDKEMYEIPIEKKILANQNRDQEKEEYKSKQEEDQKNKRKKNKEK